MKPFVPLKRAAGGSVPASSCLRRPPPRSVLRSPAHKNEHNEDLEGAWMCGFQECRKAGKVTTDTTKCSARHYYGARRYRSSVYLRVRPGPEKGEKEKKCLRSEKVPGTSHPIQSQDLRIHTVTLEGRFGNQPDPPGIDHHHLMA